jgi:hypothetical protein
MSHACRRLRTTAVRTQVAMDCEWCADQLVSVALYPVRVHGRQGVSVRRPWL